MIFDISNAGNFLYVLYCKVSYMHNMKSYEKLPQNMLLLRCSLWGNIKVNPLKYMLTYKTIAICGFENFSNDYLIKIMTVPSVKSLL
jgi:hypothetical protein